jgi:hypothetical protein
LFLISVLRTYRLSSRYTNLLVRVGAYRDPTLDDLQERGFLGTYRMDRAASASAEAAASDGALGPEIADLHRELRRWRLATFATIPVGMGLVVVFTQVLPSAAHAIGRSQDVFVAGAIAVLGLGVGVTAAIREAARLWRSGRRLSAAGYAAGGAAILGLTLWLTVAIFGPRTL